MSNVMIEFNVHIENRIKILNIQSKKINKEMMDLKSKLKLLQQNSSLANSIQQKLTSLNTQLIMLVGATKEIKILSEMYKKLEIKIVEDTRNGGLQWQIKKD